MRLKMNLEQDKKAEDGFLQRIFSIFKKKPLTVVNLEASNVSIEKPKIIDELEKENQSILRKIDDIIENENTYQFELLLAHDVKPTWEQVKKIIEKKSFLSSLPKFYENIEQYIPLIKKQILQSLNEEHISQLNKKSQYSMGISPTLIPYSSFVVQHVKKIYADDKENLNKVYEKMMQICQVNKMVQLHLTMYHPVKDLYNKLNHEEMVEFSKKARLITHDFNNLGQKMVSSLTHEFKDFSPKSLPQKAQEIFNEIKQLCLHLQNQELSSSQILEFKNLYEKKLPQVFSQYIAIPQDYREKLKKYEENPETLLLDSLDQIKIKLNEIMEQVQEMKLNEMKITNRHLKLM